MAKYVCSVCGYVYDEAKGIPEAGIPAGTAWEDVPSDWLCPLCGAAKAEFTKEAALTMATTNPLPVVEHSDDLKELSTIEVSALCSNLALGCEKQYKNQEATLFKELADYFKAISAPYRDPDFDKLLNLIEKDLEGGFVNAKAISSENHDRGALRALTWAEKATRILNSLLKRYKNEGELMLENTGVYVCTICGFVYIGENPPDLCPVCKVQSWKFEKVEGGSNNG